MIKEFCRRKKLPLYESQGLPPGKGVTGTHQKMNYQGALSGYLDVSNIEFIDWQRAFEGPVALAARLGLPLNGDFSRALTELELAGFISRDFTWSFTQGISKLSHLRLCDNYSRFYLRYVKKHKARFKKLPLAKTEKTPIGNWDAIFGLQFENVVMNSLSLIIDALGIAAADVENIGPFFQPATRGRRGVQIDLLIQTRSRTLHIIEIKTSKSLGMATIDGVRRKIAHLQKTRGYAILPSLITIHPVPSSILDNDFFYRLINLTELCFDRT